MILSVEDDEVTSLVLRHAFEQRGYPVRHARDGISAWRILEEEKPKLILLDLSLPDIDGLEFCTLVRALPDRDLARTPIIIISARDAEADRRFGLARGADDYVTKPFSVEELVGRAAELIRAAGRESRSGSLRGCSPDA